MNTKKKVSWHVLVIDDDPFFNQVLCRALTRRGCQVSGAHFAAEALSLAETDRPDSIVLDLNLCGAGHNNNGLDLLVKLKQACPDTRIVVLTGYASIATAVEAIKLGATQYLSKPVEVDVLLAAFKADGEPSRQSPAVDVPSVPLSVERLEWEHIQRVLLEHGGNISATARALKMHRRTLQRKLAKRPVKT
ncbi:MAG: response regulator transcription factor [Sterolibacterium sp.]|jgi:two-component system response regulator RegA